MKNLFGTVIALVIAVSCALLLTAMSAKSVKWGHVVFVQQPGEDCERVLLYAPKFTKKDRASFDKILAANQESFYKVFTLKSGKVEKDKTRGTLADVEVGEVVLEKVLAEAEEQGTTDQVWVCDGSNSGAKAQANAFIDDLKPVLAKYRGHKEKKK